MSRGLRLIPIILLLWLVAGLAWRLVKPGDTAIPSQMVERSVPSFQLPAAIPGKPGLASPDLATGQPRLLNIFASWCVPCVGEAPVLRELQQRGVRIDAIAVRDTPGALKAQVGNPHLELVLAEGSDDAAGIIREKFGKPLPAKDGKVLVELERGAADVCR